MRTDRTSICIRCAVRLPATGRCPRCGGTDLFDASRPSARRQALRALRRWPQQQEDGFQWFEALAAFYIKYGIFALTVVGFAVGWQLGQSALAAFLIALGALWSAVVLFFVIAGAYYALSLVWRSAALMAGWLLDRVGWRSRPVPHLIAMDDQDLVPERNLVEVRGRVRARRMLRSPLQRRDCVAFRLMGKSAVADVDDADGVDFSVVEDDGREVDVQLGAASIAIEVEQRPRLVRPDRKLTQFLERRGTYPERGAIHLAESVLLDGDSVIVEGACDEQLEPDGYRGSRRKRVIYGRRDAPLVVRRRA